MSAQKSAILRIREFFDNLTKTVAQFIGESVGRVSYPAPSAKYTEKRQALCRTKRNLDERLNTQQKRSGTIRAGCLADWLWVRAWGEHTARQMILVMILVPRGVGSTRPIGYL